ncbi:hypothetical protein SAMN05444487_111128 [Marininema mesophilum]|uniref:Uncharacterized protein n=1 Tax=Marininema mesophilum TaxID=1048340 RepID=A0A1H2ZMG7_9BACL|nr:hypothetical protein SAMN05444487_111128 [Marininema mesophilum]
MSFGTNGSLDSKQLFGAAIAHVLIRILYHFI